MPPKTVLTDAPKRFQIAGLRIEAKFNHSSVNEPVIIPGSFMAFEKNFDGEPDIRFTIDLTQSVQRGKELFRADNFMRNVIYESGPDAWEWVWVKQNGEDGLDFRVSKDFSDVLLVKNDSFQGNLMVELGFLFFYAMLSRDSCVLHGIIMEYEGRGILVLARSGTGKSTHTRMWRDEENALIINGDRCLCRKVDGKWFAYGMPWCGTSGECVNRRVAISDIVFLDRGAKNTVVPMSQFEATMRLMECIKAPTWDRDLYISAMDYCEELAQTIPMWNLRCTPDLEAVQVLKEALFGGSGSHA